MSLTSLARVREYIPTLPLEDVVTAEHLIAACSNLVENYCQRKFNQADYAEVYHGTGNQYLYTNNRPVSRVEVRTGLMAALWFLNNDATNYDATVTVTATGLVLTRKANAAPHTDTLLYADYPTINAIGTAANALGHGWVCTIAGDPFTGWASADLSYLPGTFGTRLVTASLLIHRWTLGNYRLNTGLGEVMAFGGFPRGYNSVLVKYTAGFDPIPDDLQGAVCELVKNAYDARKLDSNLQSESLGVYSYSQAAKKGWELLSVASKRTLELYRDINVGRWH